jgi:glycogen operon protein
VTPLAAAVNPIPTLPGQAGQPSPLGACCLAVDGTQGVNFAVYSAHAQRMEVCLYDPTGTQETARIALPAHSHGIWHGFVPGLGAGQLYGLRAHGAYNPRGGQRFNPAKLLLDPFARDAHGDDTQLSLQCDYQGTAPPDASVLDAQPDPVENAAHIPKARVLDWAHEWQAGASITPGPRIPMERTVLYEAHVKGLTQRHPSVEPTLRGSYAGLVSAPLLAHYRHLGITTLCLLPVHWHITEAHLLKKGLRNYWGYNTLGFFIPHPHYASATFATARAEFRHMVDQLHRNGLEVVLDVVFNHSAESDTFGPTLSWRGLDNASWYALDAQGQYINHSGCGNSFNLAHPCAIQMVMDSLRWWVQIYGVDGFRFDLATALGRDPVLHMGFHPLSALLCAIGQDPVLAHVKLIAEPWDIGPHGYQLGQFPHQWAEWNDRYRDTCRAFWLGFECTRGEFARRLTGSSDVFQRATRSPLASVNLVTAHDGMTLADLTRYQHKHNEANGEANRDGHNHNLSANAGVEGPSDDATVLQVRGQWQRALLTTLFVSQGVPQLLAGDEFGNSQGGNNNAYCQDNAIGTLDWPEADSKHIHYAAQLIHLRQHHAALRHAHWFTGHGDIAWLNRHGHPLGASEWNDPHQRSFACQINVEDAPHGQAERWLLVFHAAHDGTTFTLPPGSWRRVIDSANALALARADWAQAQHCTNTLAVSACTVIGLVQPRGPAATTTTPPTGISTL